MKISWYEWPSRVLLAIAALMAVMLVAAMIYEVFARYLFNAPTLWAFDISYMLNGGIFILGCAYTLSREAHIRIDILSCRFPLKVQRGVNALFYLALLTPVLSGLTWAASSRAWLAFVKGEVEHVSPWAPLMWPFYSILALGLAALTFQVIVDGVLYLSGRKQPGGEEV